MNRIKIKALRQSPIQITEISLVLTLMVMTKMEIMIVLVATVIMQMIQIIGMEIN